MQCGELLLDQLLKGNIKYMGTKCCICLKVIMTGCMCQQCLKELFNHKTEIVKVIASAIEFLEETLTDFSEEEMEDETLMINVKALRKAVLK